MRLSAFRRVSVCCLVVAMFAMGGVFGCQKNSSDSEASDAAKEKPSDGEDDGEDKDSDGQPEDSSTTNLEDLTLELSPAFNGRTFAQPIWAMQFPEMPDRWFVVEQKGRIETFTTGGGSGSSTWADISGRVAYGGEMGLLGMAVHPDWPNTRKVYLSYTTNEPGTRTSRISAFQVQSPSNGGPGSFQEGSEQVLVSIEQPFGNHNGGQITFGPDGYLYAGYGDGGAGGDPEDNGQDPETLLGSMLRIDPTAGDPYAIPDSNPFSGDGEYTTDEGNTVQGAEEVYAWGLRNPWRWSFDSKTGDLWAGDVGQNAWEEIDIVEKGENYGWNHKEGTHCYAEDPCDGPFEDPVVEYGRSLGKSVTGGYVYRGEDHPRIQGVYLFADYLSGRIWGIADAAGGGPYEMVELVQTGQAISSFAQGADGEIYVFDYATGNETNIYGIDVSLDSDQ